MISDINNNYKTPHYTVFLYSRENVVVVEMTYFLTHTLKWFELYTLFTQSEKLFFLKHQIAIESKFTGVCVI